MYDILRIILSDTQIRFLPYPDFQRLASHGAQGEGRVIYSNGEAPTLFWDLWPTLKVGSWPKRWEFCLAHFVLFFLLGFWHNFLSSLDPL